MLILLPENALLRVRLFHQVILCTLLIYTFKSGIFFPGHRLLLLAGECRTDYTFEPARVRPLPLAHSIDRVRTYIVWLIYLDVIDENLSKLVLGVVLVIQSVQVQCLKIDFFLFYGLKNQTSLLCLLGYFVVDYLNVVLQRFAQIVSRHGGIVSLIRSKHVCKFEYNWRCDGPGACRTQLSMLP